MRRTLGLRNMERYEVQEKLGSGGFATVYLARDVVTDKEVALKISVDANRDYIGMLKREVKFMEMLNHENVVSIIEHFTPEDGDRYVQAIVMPLMTGSLDGYIKDNAPVPFDEVKTLANQVSDGLAHMHEHGIVHGDIKPDNILIRDGTYIIADFGSAFTPADSLASTYGHCALYASPEIVLENWEIVGSAADVWSLGCVIFEALTGLMLFDAEEATDEETDYEGETDTESAEAPETDETPECSDDACSTGAEAGSDESLDPIARTNVIGCFSDETYDDDEHHAQVVVHMFEMIRVLGPMPEFFWRRNRSVIGKDGRVLPGLAEDYALSGASTTLEEEIDRNDVTPAFMVVLKAMFAFLPRHRLRASSVAFG